MLEKVFQGTLRSFGLHYLLCIGSNIFERKPDLRVKQSNINQLSMHIGVNQITARIFRLIKN
jgi:hypothetical protein